MATHTGVRDRAGSWFIGAGPHGFGGAMGMLGKFGAEVLFWTSRSSSSGPLRSTATWNMIKALGRPQYATVIGTGGMGTPLYQNPYARTEMWYQWTPKGKVKVNTDTAIGTGTLWTTGTVALYAKAGAYTTVLRRTGSFASTSGGAYNIQLVTPGLTHWLGGRTDDDHTGHIGILKLHIVPEPGAFLLLAAGAGALLWLRRVGRRC
jgi:hypothetical protein